MSALGKGPLWMASPPALPGFRRVGFSPGGSEPAMRLVLLAASNGVAFRRSLPRPRAGRRRHRNKENSS